MRTDLQMANARRALALLVAGVAGCGTLSVHREGALHQAARWVLLPVRNHGEAAQAGERVEALLTHVLRQQRRVELTGYPAAPEGEALVELEDQRRYERALSWARAQGYTYGLTGAVAEWRYRGAAEVEPAVGVTLSVVDLRSGRTLWSAAGSKVGWGRDTLSGTAQRLLVAMVHTLEVR